MASRSFPIQDLRDDLKETIQRTIGNLKVFETFEAADRCQVRQSIVERLRFPSGSSLHFMDHLKLSLGKVESVHELVTMRRGETDVVLDSADVHELMILEVFNTEVEKHQGALQMGGTR